MMVFRTRSLSTTEAVALGWGHGWPYGAAGPVVTVRAGGVSVVVRDEIAPLVETCLNRTALLYPLHADQCGGYVNRPMKYTDGSLSSTPSNHSRATAVDCNWRQNGFGKSARHDIPTAVAEIWESFGFSWGGRWNTPDWMHMEYAETVQAARLRCLALALAKNPQSPLPTTTPIPGGRPAVPFAYQPLLDLPLIAGSIASPDGNGSWSVAPDGATFGLPLGIATPPGCNGRKFFEGRLAANIHPRTDGQWGCVIEATSGELYTLPTDAT